MARRLLSYLPPNAKGVVSAVTRESYAAAARVFEYGAIAARRRAAHAIASRRAFTVARDDGWAVVPAGALSGTAPVVAAARTMVDATDFAAVRFERKEQFTNLLDMTTLDAGSAFVRFATREDVVAGVAAYLGMVPVLRYVGVWYSRHIERAPYSSQLYHQDGESPAQVKLFLLCSDVGPENGPLTVIGAHTSRRVSRQLRYNVYGGRVDDDTVRRLAGVDEHPIVGPAGTLGVVDTDRCFHFGSRVERGAAPRVVAMFQYLTPLSFRLSFGRKVTFRHLAAHAETPLARMVLGG
jgi:hypothetical protein